MECQAVPLHTIDFLIWSPAKLRPPILAPTLSHSLALCDQLHKIPSLISTLRPLTHIFHNPDFPPRINILAFSWWLNKGLLRIGNYFTSTGPISIAFCSSKLEMPPTEWFRYTQILHFLHSIWPNKSEPPRVTTYESWCLDIVDQRGGISIIYSFLASVTSKPPYVLSWKKGLDFSWDQDIWFSCFQRSFKGILSISLIEASLKVLTCWYRVPSLLAKIYPDASPLCFRNCNHIGTMYHIWWSCSRIRSLWNKVFSLICKVTTV